jgi:chromosomal replication initiation ATPase DnaA
MGPARFRFVTVARFAVYKAMRIRGWSFSQIGQLMNRDHTTVMHGVTRAEYYIEKDPDYAAKVQILANFKSRDLNACEKEDA